MQDTEREGAFKKVHFTSYLEYQTLYCRISGGEFRFDPLSTVPSERKPNTMSVC